MFFNRSSEWNDWFCSIPSVVINFLVNQLSSFERNCKNSINVPVCWLPTVCSKIQMVILISRPWHSQILESRLRFWRSSQLHPNENQLPTQSTLLHQPTLCVLISLSPIWCSLLLIDMNLLSQLNFFFTKTLISELSCYFVIVFHHWFIRDVGAFYISLCVLLSYGLWILKTQKMEIERRRNRKETNRKNSDQKIKWKRERQECILFWRLIAIEKNWID